MTTMALMTIINVMALSSRSFDTSEILVIIAVINLVIMSAMAISSRNGHTGCYGRNV